MGSDSDSTAPELQSGYAGSWVDACLPYHWSNQDEIVDYMSAGWAEYVGRAGTLPDGGGAISILPRFPYARPGGDKVEKVLGADRAAIDADLDRILGTDSDCAAVLIHEAGRFTPALPNALFAQEIARAINDWTVERWLTDGRQSLFGLVLAANQLPDVAAQEVRRVGKQSRVVGVLMGGNGLSKPFGHPLYHPIYEAAAELDLTIVLAAGGDALPDTLTHTSAGGLPTTYAEYRVLAAQPIMTHIVSMIGQGVFEKYPGLHVLVTGVGATWVPAVMWRYDNEFKALRRDAPWLTRQPSEYFRSNFGVSTYPLHATPSPHELQRLLNAFGGMESILCFGSGRSEWDANTVASVSQALPAPWWQKVFTENALRLFPRMSSGRRSNRAQSASVGA